MLNMKKYGERKVNTGEIAEIRTLDQARELLDSLGYLVEEI